MAESDWISFGTPGRGKHSVHCGCDHDDHGRCDELKDDQWCCHWFFLYWVARRDVLPTEVLRLLRGLIGTTRFAYFVKPSSKGVFRMLIHVEEYEVLRNARPDLVPESEQRAFVREDCQAWRLSCCEEALKTDWDHWRSLLEESGGPPTFSSLRTEPGTLLDDLTEEVNTRLKFRSVVSSVDLSSDDDSSIDGRSVDGSD